MCYFLCMTWIELRQAEMVNDLLLQLMKVLNEVALISRQRYKRVNAQPQEKGSVGMEAGLQERTQYSSINVGQGACLEV